MSLCLLTFIYTQANTAALLELFWLIEKRRRCGAAVLRHPVKNLFCIMSEPLTNTRNMEKKLMLWFYGPTVARKAERLKLFTPPPSHQSHAAIAAASAAVS